MAGVLLADVINDEETFGGYVRRETMRLSGMDQTGVVEDNAEMQRWLDSNGSKTLRTQFYDSLDRDDGFNVASEALPIIHGGPAITPSGISTHEDECVSTYRAKAWSASKLSKYLNVNQDDPMKAIGDDVAEWAAFQRQTYFLANVAGILAMNDLAPAGNSTHTQGDMTHDVSNGGVFSAGNTEFSADNFIEARALLGDAQSKLSQVMMGTITYTNLLKQDLIDFLVDSEGKATIAAYMGSPITLNDEMPGTGNTRDTYIFANGLFGRAVNAPDNSVAVSRSEEAGGGIGQDTLFYRVRWCTHMYGHKFVGTAAATGGPTDAELRIATNWERSAPERKQIPFVRLKTQEAV